MKVSTPHSWLDPIGTGVLVFAVTFALRTASSRNALHWTRPISQPTAKEAAMGDREFVLHVLQSRHSHPERTPAQWMRFLAALDTWFRSDRVDCVTTLQAHQFDAILRLVEKPLNDLPAPDLASLLQDTKDSKTQLACYEELWQRSAKDGPRKCAVLFASMSKLQRPRFRERLLKLWVASRGLDSLAEIADEPVMSKQDVVDAFQLCAEADPEACLRFLDTSQFKELADRLDPASASHRTQFLYRACWNLPPARALALLDSEPATTYRLTAISNVLASAVEKNPEMAKELISRYPNLTPNICGAAHAFMGSSPTTAAELINLIPGERLRTSTARSIALTMLQQPPALVETFMKSLSEPLTRETVRAAVREERKALATEPPEG